jgi:CHAT domain-containing protein/tetratricopeptide (TPR) repeat protein
MRKSVCVAVLTALLAARPAAGQEWPKPTKEGKEAVVKLVRACVEADGLELVKDAKTGRIGLAVADGAKLKAAVAAAPALPTRPLCDALVFGYLRAFGNADRAEQAAFLELLRLVGEKGKDHRTRAFAALLIARAEEGKRAYRTAITGYEASAEWFATAGEPAWQATCLANVGSAHYKLAEPGKALEYYGRALVMYQKLFPADHPDVAGSLNNVGVAHHALGEPAKALEYYGRALVMYQKLLPADHPDVAACLDHVGGAHKALGEPGKALAYHSRALQMLQKLFPGDHPDVAACLNNVGGAHYALGEPAKALGYYGRALQMRQKLFPSGHPDVAGSLDNVGSTHYALGEPGKALEYYSRALRHLRNDSTGTPAPGELAADQLRPLPLTLTVLRRRCYTFRAVLPASPSADRLRACERQYATAAALLDRLRGEVQDRDASKLHTGEEFAELAPERIGLLARLFALEAKPDHLRTALAAAEQNRARLFLESLGRSRAARLAGAPADLLRNEETLLRRLRDLDGRLRRAEAQTGKDTSKLLEQLWKQRDAAEADLNGLADKLRAAAPRYADLRYPRPCSLKEARDALRPGEVALHFVPGREASYLILLDKEPANNDKGEGLAVYPLPGAAAFADPVATLTDPDFLRQEDDARALGAELYRLLLGPAAERIKGKDLVVVADGSLCFLPFALLVEGDRYLIESHRIRYAPSLTTLHHVGRWAADRDRRKVLPDRALYALGDPDYLTQVAQADRGAVEALARLEGRTRGEGFARLEHSGREVAAIADLLGRGRCTVHTGQKASEAAVKADSVSGVLARYRYVHFATHGVLGRDGGQQPGLVLSLAGADDKDDGAGGLNDGYLQEKEVLGLRLNADLVVLSACRTGRGRLRRGEGVTGLARAFLYAGSRGVACSLWAVDDEETAALMRGLYTRLQKGESAADALREAQREMIAAGKAPLYWAPFILVGE